MIPHPGGSALKKPSAWDQPTDFSLSSTGYMAHHILRLFCSLHGDLLSYLPALAPAVPSSYKPFPPCAMPSRLLGNAPHPPLGQLTSGVTLSGSGTWPGDPFDLRLWFWGLCLPLPFGHGHLSLNCHFERGKKEGRNHGSLLPSAIHGPLCLPAYYKRG